MSPTAAHRWKIALVTVAVGSVLVPATVWAWDSVVKVSEFALYKSEQQRIQETKAIRDSVQFAELKRIALDIKCSPVMNPPKYDTDCFPR